MVGIEKRQTVAITSRLSPALNSGPSADLLENIRESSFNFYETLPHKAAQPCLCLLQFCQELAQWVSLSAPPGMGCPLHLWPVGHYRRSYCQVNAFPLTSTVYDFRKVENSLSPSRPTLDSTAQPTPTRRFES